MVLLSLYLEAVNRPHNHFRAYAIECSKDLFGAWLVQTRYGKIGSKGRTKNYAFDELNQAEKFMSSTLKKRFNATRRIGCSYAIKSYNAAEESPLSSAFWSLLKDSQPSFTAT